MICPSCKSNNPVEARFCENCGSPFNIPQEEEEKLIKNRYKIISQLAEGGMAGISLAYDVCLDKTCILKEALQKKLKEYPPEERDLIIESSGGKRTCWRNFATPISPV